MGSGAGVCHCPFSVAPGPLLLGLFAGLRGVQASPAVSPLVVGYGLLALMDFSECSTFGFSTGLVVEQ